MKRVLNLVVILIIIVTAVVLLGAIFAYVKNPGSDGNSNQTTYIDDEYGFKVHPENTWSVVGAQDKNIQLQLQHSSGCTLSYGKIDTETLSNNYNYQLNETTRYFFEKETKDIYLQNSHFRITSFWQRNQNGNDTKNIGVYINHFPQKDSQSNLILYSNGVAISNNCLNDFLKLLTSGIDLPGSLYTIAQSSTGTIQTATSFNSIGGSGDPQWDKTKTVLIFKDQGNNEQVMAYLDLRNNSYPQMQLVGNKIYFINSTGQLSLINLLSKQIENINLPDVQPAQNETPPHVVDNFFIYGNIVYYMSGESCNYYLGQCDLTLSQYNLVSKQNKTLAKNIDFPFIMGYSSVLNKLYLRWSFGDAGLYQQSVEEYDFNTSKINVLAKAESNGGVSVTPAEDQKIKTIENRLKGQLGVLTGITISEGQIMETQTPFTNQYGGIRYIQY